LSLFKIFKTTRCFGLIGHPQVLILVSKKIAVSFQPCSFVPLFLVCACSSLFPCLLVTERKSESESEIAMRDRMQMYNITIMQVLRNCLVLFLNREVTYLPSETSCKCQSTYSSTTTYFLFIFLSRLTVMGLARVLCKYVIRIDSFGSFFNACALEKNATIWTLFSLFRPLRT
jgi:hypothetical protein